MKYKLLLLCWFLAISSISAQEFPQNEFHQGEIVLNDGSTQSGMIKYDLDADVIFFQTSQNSAFLTYNVNQFSTFRILPFRAEKPRTFFTLPFRNPSGYKRPKIFEAIYDDKVSLVGREYIVVKSRPISSGFYRRSMYDPFFDPNERLFTIRYLAYNLYIVDEDGEVILLGKRRKDVLGAFKSHKSELKKYMKKEKLRMDKLEDITQLVKYYNELLSL